jgi:hypothetical protein
MPLAASWLTIVKTLPQPLATWLSKSYLTQLTDHSCALFVDAHTLPLVNNLSVLHQIYPLACQLYPDLTSLHISSISFQALLKENKISLFIIEEC